MRAVDTNVLARLLLRDDEAQTVQAEAVLGEPVWIGITVWLELGWVLRSRTDLSRATIADALSGLLAFDTVRTDNADGLYWAITRFREGADWGDMMHLIAARGVSTSFVTFDKALARAAGTSSPLPVQTLA